MNCPRCADHPPLYPFQKKTVHFDGCKECRGVFLERKVLDRVVQSVTPPREISEAPGDGYFNSLVAASEFTKSNSALVCPHCKYNMYETENRGIVLDFCLNCQAIWFDKGELEEILHRLKKGERFNLIPLPATEVDHASGLILNLLRDQWL